MDRQSSNPYIESRTPYRRATTEQLAHALYERPVRTGSSWKIPCPAHQGEDCNLAIFDTGKGPGVKCHSRNCESVDIWNAIHARLNWAMPEKHEQFKDEGVTFKASELPQIGDNDAHGFTLSRVWVYRDRDNRAYAAALRWEKGSDKKVTQWSCTKKGKWVARATRQERLPYRIHDVLAYAHTGQPLLIVEGEKCVDAVMQAWPDQIVTTWAGGSSAIEKTKWGDLKKWKGQIHMWPDNDVAGSKAMAKLGAILEPFGCDLYMHRVFGEPKSGNDVADYLDSGNTDYPEPDAFTADAAMAFDMGGLRIWPQIPPLDLALSTMQEEVRYNLRSQKMEWMRGDEWVVSDDRLEDDIRNRIEQNQNVEGAKETRPLHYSKERWSMGLNAIAYHNAIDPFIEWVEALPEFEFGVERAREKLDGFLETFFHIRNGYQEMAYWTSRYMFLGPLYRAYHPGCKLDETPVLLGPQGMGKSTLLAWLFPEARRSEWFNDNLDLNAGRKEFVEAMQGRVMVEFGEMVWDSKSSTEKLKSILTSVDDSGVRLSYRRNPESSPRRSVFVGTSNKEGALPQDETGNRRWVVVALDGLKSGTTVGDIMDYLEQNRTFLWQCAVCLYKSGLEARLPDDMAEAQRAINLKHFDVDENLDGKVQKVLEEAKELSMSPFRMDQLVSRMHLKRDPGVSEQRAIGAVLYSLGYEKRRITLDGIKAMHWAKPEHFDFA